MKQEFRSNPLLFLVRFVPELIAQVTLSQQVSSSQTPSEHKTDYKFSLSIFLGPPAPLLSPSPAAWHHPVSKPPFVASCTPNSPLLFAQEASTQHSPVLQLPPEQGLSGFTCLPREQGNGYGLGLGPGLRLGENIPCSTWR